MGLEVNTTMEPSDDFLLLIGLIGSELPGRKSCVTVTVCNYDDHLISRILLSVSRSPALLVAEGESDERVNRQKPGLAFGYSEWSC